MKRFLANLRLGALALLVLYELVQVWTWTELEESREDIGEETWIIAAYAYEQLARALDAQPPARDAAALGSGSDFVPGCRERVSGLEPRDFR